MSSAQSKIGRDPGERSARELWENRARRHPPQFVKRTAGSLIETGEVELDEDQII